MIKSYSYSYGAMTKIPDRKKTLKIGKLYRVPKESFDNWISKKCDS